MYVTTFLMLQYACIVLVEYVLPEGKRFKVRCETIDYADKKMVWC